MCFLIMAEMNRRSDERYSERHDKSHVSDYIISDWVCSEAAKLDLFWLEFSAVIPRPGGAESNEGIEVFGGPEGVHSQAGR
jgi:hypothetical protein